MTYLNRFKHSYSWLSFVESFLSESSLMRSLADFLNSRNVSPAALPISGNFLGPKIIKANATIKIKPGIPILPIPIVSTSIIWPVFIISNVYPIVSKINQIFLWLTLLLYCLLVQLACHHLLDIFQYLQLHGSLKRPLLRLDDDFRSVEMQMLRQRRCSPRPTFVNNY